MNYHQQPWPERAISIIDRAVAEWRTLPYESEPLWIAWGERDLATEQEEKALDGDNHCMSALLNWRGIDFELTIFPTDDPAAECDSARLRIEFNSIHLPRKAERLYSVVQMCQIYGAGLNVFPSRRKPGEIAILGMEVGFSAEQVTARILRHALLRLGNAAKDLSAWIKKGVGEDYWKEDLAP